MLLVLHLTSCSGNEQRVQQQAGHAAWGLRVRQQVTPALRRVHQEMLCTDGDVHNSVAFIVETRRKRASGNQSFMIHQAAANAESV